MDTIVAFVNDLPYAHRQLAYLARPASVPQRWVLVMCPPPLPQRVRRFTSAAQRMAWREDWARQTALPLQGLLAAGGREVPTHVVAHRAVAALMPGLRLRWGVGLQVLDLRLPLACRRLDPVDERPAKPGVLAPLALVSTLSALLALAD